MRVERVVPDLTTQSLGDDKCFAYAAAVEQHAEIVHPLTDEPWGVRRFFVRAAGGHVVDVLSHP